MPNMHAGDHSGLIAWGRSQVALSDAVVWFADVACARLLMVAVVSSILLLSVAGCAAQGPEAAGQAARSGGGGASPTSPSSQASPNPGLRARILAQADLIVLGVIVQRRTEVGGSGTGEAGGRFVYAIYTLSIDKVVKGAPAEKSILIRAEGGGFIPGTDVYQLPSGKHFDVGDRTLVCLLKQDNYYVVLAEEWGEGKGWSMTPGLRDVLGGLIRTMLDNGISVALPKEEWPPLPTALAR